MKDKDVTMMPREKAKAFGIETLDDAELLALLLDTGTVGVPIVEYTSRLLYKKGGLYSLFRPEQNYDGICGIGEAKRCRLLAVKEILRRLPSAKKERILTGRDAFEATKGIFFGKEEECLVVLYLGRDKSVIEKEAFSDLERTNVHFPLRTILRHALKNASAFIVLLHNHPSGSLAPSPVDIQVSEKAKQKLLLAGIVLSDSLIVTEVGFHSMKENGDGSFSEA